MRDIIKKLALHHTKIFLDIDVVKDSLPLITNQEISDAINCPIGLLAIENNIEYYINKNSVIDKTIN